MIVIARNVFYDGLPGFALAGGNLFNEQEILIDNLFVLNMKLASNTKL